MEAESRARGLCADGLLFVLRAGVGVRNSRSVDVTKTMEGKRRHLWIVYKFCGGDSGILCAHKPPGVFGRLPVGLRRLCRYRSSSIDFKQQNADGGRCLRPSQSQECWIESRL